MALAMMLPTVVFAQRGIPRSNNVSVSSTVVTHKTTKINTYDAEVGFQQMAGLFLGAMVSNVGAGASYIGGYRFNNYIFLGGGADMFISGDIALPVYAHSRFYISRYNWRPYVAASVGCNLVNIGLCLDFSLGVDARVHEKFNMYFGLGGGICSNYASLLGRLGFSF